MIEDYAHNADDRMWRTRPLTAGASDLDVSGSASHPAAKS